MKVFFWDFNESYSPVVKGNNFFNYDEKSGKFVFNSLNSENLRRDFFDQFYIQGIDGLLSNLEGVFNGIITDGDLVNQVSLLSETGMVNLFSLDLVYCPTLVAEAFSNFPDFIKTKYIKIPLTGNSFVDNSNLKYSLFKPSETMYSYAAMNAGVDPEDCYVVGTSYKDFKAGRSAGMNTIHIRGWEKNESFKFSRGKERPDYVINRSNMRNGLEKIFNSLK